MKNWDNVVLVPEFDEQGVACYRLEGGDYENEYYVSILLKRKIAMICYKPNETIF